MINQKPQRVFFSLGLWLFSSLFISIQLLPPATRARLSEIVGAMVEMMVADTMFLLFRFVILLCLYL
jgi:hypothetical protein